MPRALALLSLVALGTTAFAEVVATKPKYKQRVVTAPGGDQRLARLVRERAPQIIACAGGALLKARVRAAFDHGQRARQIVIQADGDHPFERCVAAALRGRSARGGGKTGPVELTFAIDEEPVVVAPPRKPVVPAPPPPKPVVTPAPAPHATSLTACRADDDCTLHYRVHACVSSDPVAVNKRQLEAARKAFPVKDYACGMGGPQYDELRMSSEGRYHAECVKNRCEVNDRGALKSPGF